MGVKIYESVEYHINLFLYEILNNLQSCKSDFLGSFSACSMHFYFTSHITTWINSLKMLNIWKPTQKSESMKGYITK